MDSAPPIIIWTPHLRLADSLCIFLPFYSFYSPYRVVDNDTDAHNECVSNVDYLDGKQVWIAGSNSWSKDVNIILLFKYTSDDKE